MARTSKKQSKNARDAMPIRIGNPYWEVIRRLAYETRKTQRVIIEEHLDLAFKIRRVAGAPAVGAPAPAAQEPQV